jgi:predicted choloylglycine hydrolase
MQIKNQIGFLILAFLLSILVSDKLFCQQEKVIIKGNLKILVLEGTPYEVGFQHGRFLKNEIHERAKSWQKAFGTIFLNNFISKTNFLQAIERYSPKLLEELKGISDGSGIDFNIVFSFQLLDEIDCMRQNISTQKCTSIGIKKTNINPTFVAQNMDITDAWNGYQTLLHIKNLNEKMEKFVFTAPGLIGLNGINNHSVAVAINSIQQLKYSKNGIPVLFVTRAILDKKTYEDAVKFLYNIEHAAGQNYIIGGIDSIASFECSATKIAKFIPFKGANFTYHTNIPLINDDYNSIYIKKIREGNKNVDEYKPYCPRLKSLRETFNNNSIYVNGEKLKSILSSRDWNINKGITFGCTIMVLSENPELHLSPGRPDVEPFQVFKFNVN